MPLAYHSPVTELDYNKKYYHHHHNHEDIHNKDLLPGG